MDRIGRDSDGYYPGASSHNGRSSRGGSYHNEQPPANFFFRDTPLPSQQQQQQDMQHCYQQQPNGMSPFSFPNDPCHQWQQQNAAWAQQMQLYHTQQTQLQHLQQTGQPLPVPHYLPPPPPPPPASMLLGGAPLHPPPPPPNLDAILDCEDDDVVEQSYVPSRMTSSTMTSSRSSSRARTREREPKKEVATPPSSSQPSPSKSAAGAAAAAPPPPPPPAPASTITLSSTTSSACASAVSSTTSLNQAMSGSGINIATPSHLSTASGSQAPINVIPSLLEGLRADLAARDQRDAARGRVGSAPDLRSIEHAASILSARSAKVPSSTRRSRSREDRRGGRGRRDEERSDSRKENRIEPTRDRRRDERRRDGDERRRDGDRDKERERPRSSQRTRSPHVSSTTTTPSRRRREDDYRSERDDKGRNGERRRRNGDRRREEHKEDEQWVEKEASSKAEKEDSGPLRPSDIQLNVREGATAEGGVQVYLHSDEEDEEDVDGEDEYDEDEDEDEEEEEEAADSDMDIETETDDMVHPATGPSASLLQLQLHDSSSHSKERSSCLPEDEEEHRLTPDVFFASGPSRRVNSPMYREKYKRARALASRALSEEYRERYDLISKHLRSRCIFRGLPQSSCGPDAPKLTINDPRPKSKHVQTFPSKESNVQYAGPDSFVTKGYEKSAAAKSTAYANPFSYVSQTKLVRAKAPAPVSPRPPASSLKRTIQNGAAAPAAAASASVSSTQSSASSTATTTAAAAAAAAAADSDGPTPPKLAKLSKVDQLMASLAMGPSPSESEEERSEETTSSSLRKVASESNVAAMKGAAAAAATRSDEAPRLLSASLAAAHSPRAERATTAAGAKLAAAASPGAPKPALPPRSALSFRKIGEHVVRPGSKLCFEWAESGGCSAGVFCHYEHGEGAARVEKAVCGRMLRGLCRGEPSCPFPHGLLPHQMPICEHYLRMQCNHSPEECGLVHIKHNEKVPVCAFFNQGKCKKEDDCTFRHQYRSDVVRAIGVHETHAPPAASAAQRGLRSSRLPPKGRALLTAAAARSPARPAAAAPAAAAAPVADAPDTSTFAWIE